LIFDTLNAYQRTGALRAAIELDLFTAIAEGTTTAKAIAARVKASEKGTRVLCDFLTVVGFLSKLGQDYSLTPDSAAFLSRKSPAYLGSATGFFGQMERQLNASDGIAAAVRKGGTVLSDQGIMSPEDPIWVEFARSMGPMMAMPAGLLAKMISGGRTDKWKVLDIAAGHGLFGISIAKQDPNAQIVALDWEAVLEVARENAAKANVSDRFSTIVGNALEVDLGSGYDIIVIANFLQLLDVKSIDRLMRKVHTALAPGGGAVTLGFIPNDDRVSPPVDANFGMIALAFTGEGDAYTVSEYERMFQNAGFSRSELLQLTPSPQRVIVSYK
jgi:ubiquinone/menaquinone biosynthesis C-methylase UbiE